MTALPPGLARRLAGPRTLLALALTVAALLLALHWTGASAGFASTVLGKPFDERLNGYDPAQALAVIAGMDTPQYRAYLRYRLLDLPLPWVLGAWMTGALTLLGAHRLAWVGLAVALVDTLENLALWTVMLQDAASAAVVHLASGLTQLKWVVDGLSLGLLGVVMARRWLLAPAADGEHRG